LWDPASDAYAGFNTVYKPDFELADLKTRGK
jgi:hypothetical protein